MDTDAVMFKVGAGVAASEVAVTGPMTGINKALGSMIYVPAADFIGLDAISEVSDNGYWVRALVTTRCGLDSGATVNI